MTMELFLKKLSKISNQDLINSCEDEIIGLCKSGGRSIKMTVPPSVNDTDILLTELINRYKELLNNGKV